MSYEKIDVTLGLNAQALALLHLLAGHSIEDFVGNELAKDVLFHIETRAWYNGRERGVVLTFDRSGPGLNWPKPLHINFVEARAGDEICVQSWRGDVGDVPTVEDAPEDTWNTRKRFPYGQVNKACNYIRKLTRGWASDIGHAKARKARMPED